MSADPPAQVKPPTPTPTPIPTSATPHARRRRGSLLGSVIFTGSLLGAIALALGGTNPVTAVSTVLAILILVGIFHFSFSGSDFFNIIFANAVGVYACIYLIFVSSNFPQAHSISVQIAFILPLASFGAGVLTHRSQIQHLIDRTQKHVAVPFREGARWIGPLTIIAVLTTYFQIAQRSTYTQDAALVISMSAIAGVAWLTSKNIALFLLECGLIFRGFLRNAQRLARPAFGLLTCYSLITIVFGCIYTVYDQASPSSHFLSNGVSKTLTFPDGLYLSVSTLTTVGFSDIVAVTPLARLIVTGEVLCGILLLLFGVEAVLDHRRES